MNNFLDRDDIKEVEEGKTIMVWDQVGDFLVDNKIVTVVEKKILIDSLVFLIAFARTASELGAKVESSLKNIKRLFAVVVVIYPIAAGVLTYFNG